MKILNTMNDFLNPFLVKEARQSLRSRFLHITIIASTLVSALIVIFGLVQSNYDTYYDYSYNMYGYSYATSYGRVIFENIYRILWVITIGLFPLVNGIRFYYERHTGEFELFEITGIKPSKIIRGKIQTSIVLSLLIIVLCTPFLMICTFLTGISGVEILFYIVFMILGSVFSSAAGILTGSLNVKRVVIVLLFLAFGGMVFLSFVLLIGMQYNFNFADFFSSYSSDMIGAISVVVLFFVYYYPLFSLCSTASISSKKRINTIGIRTYVLASGLFLIIFSLFLLEPVFSAGVDDGFILIGYYLLFFPVLFVSMFIMFGSSQECPEGLRSRFDKGILKVLRFLYYPGRGSMTIWFSIVLYLIFISESVFIGAFSGNTHSYSYLYDIGYTVILCIVIMLLYSYAGIVLNSLTRLIFKHRISNMKAAGFMNLLIIILSALFGIAGVYDAEYFFPFYYLFESTEPDFFFNSGTWSEFILFVITANLIYGIVLFAKQYIREKTNP
jgi:hypothetical protein